jgi:hypothetical protein
MVLHHRFREKPIQFSDVTTVTRVTPKKEGQRDAAMFNPFFWQAGYQTQRLRRPALYQPPHTARRWMHCASHGTIDSTK